MLMNQKMRPTRKLFQCFSCIFPQQSKQKNFILENLNGKTTAEIMDFIQRFTTAKSPKIDTVLFSVLGVTSSMSGKKMNCREEYGTTFHSTFILTAKITLLLYAYHI